MAYSLLLLRMAVVLALATYQRHLALAPTSSCWVACSQAMMNQAAKQSRRTERNSSSFTEWRQQQLSANTLVKLLNTGNLLAVFQLPFRECALNNNFG
jgi:hypothetical protein